LIKRGEVARGLPVLKNALEGLDEARSTLPYMVFQGELGEVLGRAGQLDQGVAIESAIEQCERREELWSIPELMRIKGQLLLLDNAASVAGTAEDQFQQAIDCARRQGALSWELRGATSLARLWCNQGRSEAAYQLLAPGLRSVHRGLRDGRPQSGQYLDRRFTSEQPPASVLTIHF